VTEGHASARRFGALSVDSNARRVRVRDRDVSTTAVEFALLEALSEHPGWLYSHSQLGSHLRDDGSGDPHTIAVHVSNLRRKLRAAGLAADPIETVRGLGYRLVAHDPTTPRLGVGAATGSSESLGDALVAGGRHGEAADAYSEALGTAGRADNAVAARLHLKLAQTAIERRLLAEADLHNAAAARDLQKGHPGPARGRQAAEIDVRLQKAAILYFGGSFGEALSLCDQVEDSVGTRLSPRQLMQLHGFSYLSSATVERFALSARTVGHARACYDAWRETGQSDGAPFAEGLLGMALLWSGDLIGAEQCLSDALRQGDVNGDGSQRPPLLGNLGLVARIRGDVAGARHYAGVLLAEIDEKDSPDHAGGAHGLLAWTAWRDGEMDRAEAEGVRGFTAMRAIPRFPFQWIALAPLMAVEARRGDVAAAVLRARTMLDESQQRLPETLVGPLARSVAAWDGEREADAAAELRAAVAAGRSSGHT
jgi:DNA-binding winged helix-turn-helix (wHTH) protein